MSGKNQSNQNIEVIFPKHWPALFDASEVGNTITIYSSIKTIKEISYFLAITSDIKNDLNIISKDLKSLNIRELECGSKDRGEEFKEDFVLNLHLPTMPVSFHTILKTLNEMSESDLSKYKILHLPLNCHVLENAVFIRKVKKILQSKNQRDLSISVQIGHFYFTRFDFWNNHLRQCFAIISAMIEGVDRFVLHSPHFKNDSSYLDKDQRRNLIRSVLTAPRVLQEETDLLSFQNSLDGSEMMELFLNKIDFVENLEEEICRGTKIITGVNHFIDNTLDDQRAFFKTSVPENRELSFLDNLEFIRISWMNLQKTKRIVVHLLESSDLSQKILIQRKSFLESFLAFPSLEFSLEKNPSKGNLLFIIGNQNSFNMDHTQYDHIILVSGIDVEFDLHTQLLVINAKVRMDHFWNKILEYYNK